MATSSLATTNLIVPLNHYDTRSKPVLVANGGQFMAPHYDYCLATMVVQPDVEGPRSACQGRSVARHGPRERHLHHHGQLAPQGTFVKCERFMPRLYLNSLANPRARASDDELEGARVHAPGENVECWK
jgi:hypothetical protein